jgi:hypothetical protein
MPRSRTANVRYVAAAAALIVVSFAALVFAERSDTTEEAVVTAPAEATAVPDATPTPLATPTPAPMDEQTTATGADLANTEPLLADEAALTGPLVDGYFVPSYVSLADRTGTGTDRSALDPTPTPAAAPAPAPPATAVPQPTPEPTEVPESGPSSEGKKAPQEDEAPAEDDNGGGSGFPRPGQWEALRQCESGGNYAITNPSGLYRGAYQFSQATWDWVAGVHYPHLAGVDPITVAPADQDQMAYRLYEMAGWKQWPVCGRNLL